jgi:hypothetical protein
MTFLSVQEQPAIKGSLSKGASDQENITSGCAEYQAHYYHEQVRQPQPISSGCMEISGILVDALLKLIGAQKCIEMSTVCRIQ